MYWEPLSIDNEREYMYWVFLSMDNEMKNMYWMPLPTDNRSTHLLDSLSTADDRRRNGRRRGAMMVLEVARR